MFLDVAAANVRKKADKKRRGRIALILIICAAAVIAFVFALLPESAAAKGESDKEIEDKLNAAVDEAIDKIDTKAFEDFIKSLSKEQQAAISVESIKKALKSIADGEQKDFVTVFLELGAASAANYFAGFIPAFLSIIVICMLKNTLSGMTGDFLNTSTTEVVHIVCYAAVVVILMTGVVSVINTVTSTVENMARFAEIVFPVLLTLLSLVGGASSVALYQPMMGVMSGFSIQLIISVILPAFIATIVFSVVGNMSKTVKLQKMTKLIKSGASWLIGIVFGLFATFLTVQGITGGVVDKFGFNAAKFALSSYVPVLGGYLSDGFDLLSASLVLVKNAFGLTGVTVILSVMLFPLLKLVVFMLGLRLTSAVAEPVGDARVSGMMSSLADSMSLLTTALAGAGFMFFIIIMLIIGSCNMGI